MSRFRSKAKALADGRIAIVQVEVRFDKPGPHLEAFRQYLVPVGYPLYGIYTQARARVQPPSAWPPAWADGFKPRVLNYCDAVFMRVEREEAG